MKQRTVAMKVAYGMRVRQSLQEPVEIHYLKALKFFHHELKHNSRLTHLSLRYSSAGLKQKQM